MLPNLNIENVYLYIADDLRADFAPVDVLNRGLRFRTVASGIHSPTSISSILSGTYLPQHQVGYFQDTLADDVPNIVHRDDIRTYFSNTMARRLGMDPSTELITRALDIDTEPVDRFDEVDPPFVFVERAIGGHAPYVQRGESVDGEPVNGRTYHRQRADAPRHQLATEYEVGIEDDTEWFIDRLNQLEERGLLDDTLVIYVSDHGELLGENGMLSHAPPIHPSHVYVPTVFIHPDLPAGQEADGVLRHVDILPTISSLFDWKWETPVQPVGLDLTSTGTAEYGFTFYAAEHSTPLGPKRFRLDSIWDREGGYVFPEMSALEQAMLAGYHLLKAHWREYAQRHLLNHLVFKLRGTRCHGAPGFGEAEGKRLIREARQFKASKGSDQKSDIPTEHLEQLGYLE